MRRILHATYANYLDNSSGASVASRSMLEYLACRGFAVEVVCGPGLEAGRGEEVAAWVATRGMAFEARGGESWTVGAAGVQPGSPGYLHLTVRGVGVSILRGSTTPRNPDDLECRDFLTLFEAAWSRFRPDVVVSYGGGPIAREVLARSRLRGAATVFALHNLRYRDPAPFADADAVIVASRFAADHYRALLGLECVVLPYLVDVARVRAEVCERRYVVFVNPTVEKGVFVFARIADELGRTRPDIPFLVVESKGTEADVAACGLDLRAHRNVFFMAHTPDPRRFWRLAKLSLLPSLVAENQPMAAVEAMTNGVPVVGSGRGGIPEALGAAGLSLPLPTRLAQGEGKLPTADEIALWIRAIINLWDDAEVYADRSRLASAEALRWAPETVGPMYVSFFSDVRTVSDQVV